MHVLVNEQQGFMSFAREGSSLKPHAPLMQDELQQIVSAQVSLCEALTQSSMLFFWHLNVKVKLIPRD